MKSRPTEKSKLIVPDTFLSSQARKRPEAPGSPSDREQYWWNFPGVENHTELFFEGIDTELVGRLIRERINADEVPLIEIPEHVMKTLRLLDKPDFSFLEVAQLIERSPAMAGEFIKIINSAFHYTGMAVKDLKSVLPRLGKVKVKSLLFIYASRMNILDNKQFSDVAVEIVEHSYAVGLIALYLSLRYYPDPDAAFLAGLMHDIGKLAILKGITEAHAIPDRLEYPLTEDVFREIFAELHEKAGAFIAVHWKLPQDVKNAILHHHDLRLTGVQSDDIELTVNLCHLINVSDAMARLLGKGRPFYDAVNIFELPSARALGIERDWSTVDFFKEIPAMIDFKLAT